MLFFQYAMLEWSKIWLYVNDKCVYVNVDDVDDKDENKQIKAYVTTYK